MYLKQLIRDHLYQEVSDTLRDQLDPISYDYSLSLLDQKITPSLERFDIQVVSRPPLIPINVMRGPGPIIKGINANTQRLQGIIVRHINDNSTTKGILNLGDTMRKDPESIKIVIISLGMMIPLLSPLIL